MSISHIVTSGCYSDYSIRAVFSTKERAQAFIDELKEKYDYRARDADIEEWEIDEETPSDHGLKRIHVLLKENGDTYRVEESQEIAWWQWYISYSTFGTVSETLFSGTVFARDNDHAIKMARDTRAASIAAGDLETLKSMKTSGFRSVKVKR